MDNSSSMCLSELILYIFLVEFSCFFGISNNYQQYLFYLQIRILVDSSGLLVIKCQSFEFCLPSTRRISSHGVETDWKAGSEQCPGARLE